MFVKSRTANFTTCAEKLVTRVQERSLWDLTSKLYYNRDILFEGGISKTVIYMFMDGEMKCKRWRTRNVFRKESLVGSEIATGRWSRRRK